MRRAFDDSQKENSNMFPIFAMGSLSPSHSPLRSRSSYLLSLSLVSPSFDLASPFNVKNVRSPSKVPYILPLPNRMDNNAHSSAKPHKPLQNMSTDYYKNHVKLDRLNSLRKNEHTNSCLLLLLLLFPSCQQTH